MIYTDTLTPTSYATKLATYIDNPTTIRAHVKNFFGRAPSVDQCANLRRSHLAKVESFKRRNHCHERFSNFRCGHEQTDDNIIVLSNGYERCKTCEADRVAKLEADRAKRAALLAKERADRLKAEEIRERLDMAKRTIDVPQGPRPRLSSDTVRLVATLMAVTPEDMLSGSRAKRLVAAKAVAARVFRQSGLSYPQIAGILKMRNHTSIIYLVETFSDRARQYPDMWDVFDAVAKL